MRNEIDAHFTPRGVRVYSKRCLGIPPVLILSVLLERCDCPNQAAASRGLGYADPPSSKSLHGQTNMLVD